MTRAPTGLVIATTLAFVIHALGCAVDTNPPETGGIVVLDCGGLTGTFGAIDVVVINTSGSVVSLSTGGLSGGLTFNFSDATFSSTLALPSLTPLNTSGSFTVNRNILVTNSQQIIPSQSVQTNQFSCATTSGRVLLTSNSTLVDLDANGSLEPAEIRIQLAPFN